MDNNAKKTVGILSFLPFIAWSITIAYVLILNRPLVDHKMLQDHELLVQNIALHYGSISIFLIITVLITAGLIYYYVIHLAKLKNLNAPTKMVWIIFMIVFGALAFPVMWYLEIRKEPKNTPMYPTVEGAS
jgi:hypothetical protein